VGCSFRNALVQGVTLCKTLIFFFRLVILVKCHEKERKRKKGMENVICGRYIFAQ